MKENININANPSTNLATLRSGAIGVDKEIPGVRQWHYSQSPPSAPAPADNICTWCFSKFFSLPFQLSDLFSLPLTL